MDYDYYIQPGFSKTEQIDGNEFLLCAEHCNGNGSLWRTASTNLLDKLTESDAYREDQVALFVRQLLSAIEEMHSKKFVHLDLRPETILLKDDNIKLEDFGQSRRLLKGKPTYGSVGSPEFVSPEIVNVKPVTLAADMWSIGALAYTLLSGMSPFLGDSDEETLKNVSTGKYSLSPTQFDSITDDAKDFITQLLLVEPSKRLTALEALDHPWMKTADKMEREGQRLSTDCLREFKYRHKWAERRVFVQQSPSDVSSFRVSQPPVEQPQLGTVEQLKPSLAQPTHIRPPPPYPGLPADKKRPEEDRLAGLRIPEYRAKLSDDAEFERQRAENLHHRLMQARMEGMEMAGDVPDYAVLAPRPGDIGPTPVPRTLVKGEQRSIEEEIANRILSDISEENSVEGSQEDLNNANRQLKEYHRLRSKRSKSRSRSSTPLAQMDGEVTPTGSPGPLVRQPAIIMDDYGTEIPVIDLESYRPSTRPGSSQSAPDRYQAGGDPYRTEPTRGAIRQVKQSSPDRPGSASSLRPPGDQPLSVDVDPLAGYYGDRSSPVVPEFDDPNVPVGAPVFVEGLQKRDLIVMQSGEIIDPQAKKPKKPPPGHKSEVRLSPSKEEVMEVVIATKRGKISFLPSPEIAGDFDDEIPVHVAKQTVHDDLERYRPKHFYGDDDLAMAEIDIDDYDWESQYQIGPETLLLATKGPSFNARVRDYRRELWGDGAPLVNQGILGYRNADVSVRERRRFTDLMREDKNIAKSVSTLDNQLKAMHAGAVRRVQSDTIMINPPTPHKGQDGSFAPVFQRRLKDVSYNEDTKSITFHCTVIGRPLPNVTWFHNDSPLIDDARRESRVESGRASLTIKGPMQYSDGGVYTVLAENEHGEASCCARLKMGDVPDPPGRPEIELASDTELFITWEPPNTANVVDISAYRLDYRRAAEHEWSSAKWVLVSENIDEEAVVLRFLEPMGVYQFRVTACNSFGWGTPSLSSRIIRTHQRGAPKLNLDVLRSDTHLAVISMPQASLSNGNGRQPKHALNEIKEDVEEEEPRTPLENKSQHLPSVSGEVVFLNTADDACKRFQLEQEIYRGRFGLIREAVDSKSESASHLVAKIMISSGERAKAAHSEYDLLRESQHENVVQLLAAYDRDGFVLLFTERLRETIFDRFCYRDYFTEEQIARSILQLAAAIQWLQYKGIVHMDIQPDNVMFTGKRQWTLKLIDFGSAVQLSSVTSPKPRQPVAIEFAPPELVAGPTGLVTPQCDIWGLGLITFFLLSGFHPYSADDDTVEEIKDNICRQKCDPNLIYTQASQESLRFVTWALKKKPARRMTIDEAIQHRWLALDDTMTRRRENIKYPSNRLRKLANRLDYKRRITPTTDNQLLSTYGAAKTVNGFSK